MAPNVNNEEKALCPVAGCSEEIVKRGMYMHIYQTDDPEGEAHHPRYEFPPHIDVNEVKITGEKEIEMDFPESIDLDDTRYLDTYTGKPYKGKRGLMIHLGQVAGQNNIPADVTDKHDANEFPIVKVDDQGNITEVIKEGEDSVPPMEPYLPWVNENDRGYIRRAKVESFVEDIRNSPTGAASPEAIERELLESNT